MSGSVSVPRLIHGVKQLLPYVVKSSKGSIVTTECGRKYLDFSCGIGVTNLGHSHEGVCKAVIEAVPNIVHAQPTIMKHRPLVDLVDKLADLDISRKAKFDSFYFWSSGAEAVEAAVKLARQATNKQNIITVNLGFHGRTFGAMALTTSGSVYRSGFGPLMSGVSIAPFPYLTHSPYAIPPHGYDQWSKTPVLQQYWGNAPADIAAKDTARCLEALELLLRTQSAANETAAILLEPILGEGGYVPCPPGYLKALRELCDKHGILLICDEIQTGYGRTGTMFASEWIDNGVSPDILISAKGIANGFPLSAIFTRSDISSKQLPSSMGGTYCCNAIGCAAANAVLTAFKEEKVLENVQLQEQGVRSGLNALMATSAGEMIREVRGKGLMIGVEFESWGVNKAGNKPGATAYAVVQEAAKRGLLLLSCGPYDTIRLIPPLNVTTTEMNQGLKIFQEAVTEVYQNQGEYKY